MSSQSAPAAGFVLARRALPVIGLCVAIVVLVLLLWYLVDVLLLAFAGVLLALVLRAPADWLARRARLPGWLALGLVIVLGAALLGAAGAFFGSRLSEQLGELSRRLPEIVAQLRHQLAQFDWILGSLQPRELIGSKASFVGRGIDLVTATFGVAANIVIVLFIAFFIALQPRLYLRGALRLVPQAQRSRAEQVLRAVGDTLKWWLLGQLFMMLLIGTAVGIGLSLLGVPMALALGVLAGLLEFVPYLGPILAAIPAILVALAQSPALAGYVLLLYVAIQAVEGNILQPLVQQRTIYLPPAMILFAQVVLGILLGVLGVMLATPLAASFMVLTRMLYVEDVLGDRRRAPV